MVVCIDPNSTIGRIDPKLHGQFIEFLGECIDGGLWVGEDSPIENERGYRKATLDGFACIEAAGYSLAGRMLCGYLPLA